MHKHLLAGLTGLLLTTKAAAAQTYPPPTTPPEIPAPTMGVPSPGRSTTTVAPSPYGGWQATTIRHGVDRYGNPVSRRDIYREGIAGSSESHTLTTDTGAGGSTGKTTATKPE